MQKADIIEFKRGKFFSVSGILGNILKLFDHKWGGWGWHVAFAWEKTALGWYILEATRLGVMINFYPNEYLSKNTRYWEWFMDYPEQDVMDNFAGEVVGKKYDVAVYFSTALQYLILRVIEWFQKKFIPWHKFTISLPRILNDRWTCWELVFWFCRTMGKPIQESIGLPATRYPLISDFVKAMNTKIT